MEPVEKAMTVRNTVIKKDIRSILSDTNPVRKGAVSIDKNSALKKR